MSFTTRDAQEPPPTSRALFDLRHAPVIEEVRYILIDQTVHLRRLRSVRPQLS